jgi:arsenite transporter
MTETITTQKASSIMPISYEIDRSSQPSRQNLGVDIQPPLKLNGACCGPSVVEAGDCQQDVTTDVAGVPEEDLDHEASADVDQPLGFFARWLTLWVFLAMVLGTLIGALVPSIPAALEKATVESVWIPGAVLVWLMVYPMMLGVRWSALRQVPSEPKGLFLTCFVNWAVQPFSMYGLAVLFFDYIYDGILDPDTQKDYIAGAVILGGSPCTAMVFVWSALTHGDPNYTLAQVVLNDLILLVLYVPTVQLLLHMSDIALPWGTIFLSVALFVAVPFALGAVTQVYLLRKENGEDLLGRAQAFFKPVSAISLILLVVFIFISQAQVITDNATHVLLIMVPLILQTWLIFLLTYSVAFLVCLKHNIAGPASFIGSSNFFELAVAIALTVYGPGSGAVLVTVVGVLVEVPVMLLEVAIVNATKKRYEMRLVRSDCHCNKVD